MKKTMAALLCAAILTAIVGCVVSGSGTLKLVAATSPDYPPYESYDEQGNLVGFDIEVMEEIVKILSSQTGANYELEWKEMSFDTIISAVQTNQADIGVSCFSYDPDRDVIFSIPYLESAQVVAVLPDSDIVAINDLAGKKIGAGEGTTGARAAKEMDDTEVVSSGDYLMMFEALKNGNLDAVVCDEAVALNHAKESGYRILDEKLVDEKISVIFRNEDIDLSEKVNKAIADFVASPKYEELKVKFELQ